MRMVVPVKHVAKLDDAFELEADAQRIGTHELDYELNEWDRFSLEAAVQLRESAGDGDVLAVSAGDEEAEEVLLECLAAGADRAIRVWDDSLCDADVLGIARVLAAVAERESANLILCGAQSSDAVNGATGVAMAGYLNVRHVAVVTQFECDLESSSMTVERELEGGLVDVLRLELPALLTIQTGLNEPRYATLRAIKQARNKPIEVLDLTALGLAASDVGDAAGSRTRRLTRPVKGGGAEMLDGSPAEIADGIANLVRDRIG